MAQAKHRIQSLSVHFISLVDAPANQRPFLVKRAGAGEHVFERQAVIAKRDAARRVVYGMVLVPGEEAAYGFMQSGATGQIDADHDREVGKGFVADSWIVRKDDALFPDETPGSWAVGVKVTDDETWQRVDEGELVGFSVMGLARREAVGEAEVAISKAASNDNQEGGDAMSELTGFAKHIQAATEGLPDVVEKEASTFRTD